MPGKAKRKATSEKQRQLMAIAEHHPSKVYSKNKGVLGMSKAQLHEFAATKGLKGKGKSKRQIASALTK